MILHTITELANSKLTDMTNLERALDQLKSNIADLMELVYSQLEKSEEAFSDQNVGLAKEIHQIEARVNATDLSIGKDCEDIVALFNPVAVDLRLVLASMMIISSLERIGDHADKIARYVRKKQITDPFKPKLLKVIRFAEMFDNALDMVKTATQAFIEEDTEKARAVFTKDVLMNEIYNEASRGIKEYAEQKKVDIELILYLFSIINKLERVGDLSKNIAEETIFFVEAEVLRHRRKLKKKSGESSEEEEHGPMK